MLKKWCLIAMSLALIISAAGCDGKKGNTSKPASSNTSSSQSNSDSSTSSGNDDGSTDDSVSSGTKTVTTTVAKRTKPQTETKTMKKEYTFDGDIAVKDELKLGKYKYVWGDEFNGTSLDENKWNLWDNVSISNIYDMKPLSSLVKVQDGCLNLTVERYYDPTNDSYKWAQAYNVTTQNTMNFEHGYFEMRAKVPFKTGVWPAYWFKSWGGGLFDYENLRIRQNRLYEVEIDVFEVIGDLDKLRPNIHKWYLDGTNRHVQGISVRNNYIFEDTTFLNDEYHIYGFLWTEKEISMFVDGEKYNTFDLSYNIDKGSDMTGFSDSVWYLILGNGAITPAKNHADSIGSDELDEYEPSDLPAVFSIDWIRLYQDESDTLTKLFTK